MKKFWIILIALSLLGCQGQQKGKNIIARVNNYEITKEDFEEEFKDSAFGRTDTLESRKEFLNNLVNRKLIMQDAQKQGLDKEKEFLRLIEKFWEQSLMLRVLDKKTNAIAGTVSVSDQEIEEAYKKMQQEGKADKPYGQLYEQIKWELTRNKQAELMEKWITDLRKNSVIKLNYDLLENK